MNLRFVRYFVTSYELGSMAKAYKALNVAQPTIIMGIRALERELEVRLLVGHRHGVGLTSAGLNLLPWLRSLLKLEDDIRLMSKQFNRLNRRGPSEPTDQRLRRHP